MKDKKLIVPMNNNLDWATYLMNNEIRGSYVNPKMGLDPTNEGGKQEEKA
ncbi:hypothetical protein [Pallidibacillus pasinlerensis]|uniref:Uncharacterized protein n=1 Tax=Pallidibacillus pasinlerensis TaxID=2703818 RepID=A0ABX0A4V5_9BACI|nr:hypothetical protein [Pallidibacillus pasinlerensis]NCU18455.1 hypothetical protein [Pallidibacillus pasinlerensis]